MSINRVIITGNLTCDPELRRTQSGMAIMSFGLAVNDRRKNAQTGEWEDYANFVDCTMFGTRAESVANYISKGSKVGIEGKLRYSTWEREGQKRSKLEVVVDEIEFLSPRQNGSGGGYAPQGQQAGGYAYGNGNAPQTAAQRPQGGYQQQPTQQQWSDQQYAQSQQQYSQPQQQPQQAQPAEPSSSIYDDDIPF